MPVFDIPCVTCATLLSVSVSNPHIINMFSVTAIVLEHPEPVLCPVCNQMMVAIVAGVGSLALAAQNPNDVKLIEDVAMPPTTPLTQ